MIWSLFPKMKSSQAIICLSSSYHVFFLFYGLAIICPTSTAISASYGGNETDYSALLSFKSMITQDTYSVLTSWNDSLHFCDWNGVSCGKRHRRVTALYLVSQGLEGSLSPHIGNLSFLHEFSLFNNSFQGTIPHELGRLSRLRYLDLKVNKFNGVIPTNFSGCLNLKKLGLSHNELVGSIPKEISFLSKLTHLAISFNKLTGGIPPFLGNLTAMESFRSTTNPLGGNIPDTLGHWKSLSEFGCGECNLTGAIPHCIYNLSLLTVFSFPENVLTGSLPLETGEMLPNLEFLQLRQNQLSGLLPPSISNCSKLWALELGSNNFNAKLTIDFGKLSDVIEIYLPQYNFHGHGEADDMKFIDSLKNCSRLQMLDIWDCGFQGSLPSSIGNLSNQLEYMDIGENQLNGNIPSSIGSLAGLATLHIGSNQFTGKIPLTIGKLQNLQVLDLAKAQFSGPIPHALGNLSLLNYLSLHSNRLEGQIPSSLGNCHYLLELYLSDNKLSGKTPKQLLQLTSLSIALDLSQNQLSGSIPTEVGDLKMLTSMDFSYNNITGNIPSSLGGCISLSFLSLNGNLLTGMIPQSLNSLRGLKQFNLSHNKLFGNIPRFLESFALESIDLSYNNFDGEVPVKGVFANASEFSVLENNRLCGGLVELGLPRCKEMEKHHKKFPLIVIVILIVSTFVGILCFVYVCCKKKSNGQLSVQLSMRERFPKISYNQLLKATDGFSEANLIGQGGLSSVYKGILGVDDDRFVAVKVLHLQNRGAGRSFMRECEAWRSIRHRNLLKIITACSSVDFQGNDFKALVYEFMPQGSLHDWLHSTAKTSRLNLLQRINILMDVACALDYLHNRCQTMIVHGDLKPSNILLDDDMVAHVGDFGLARFLGTDSNQNSSTGVKGTVGYAPPEYGLGSEMTSSGDVYSYGILLLEVITGKKPTDDIFNEGLSLHKYAYMSLPDHVIDVIDGDAIVLKSTKENARKVEECLTAIVKIGVSCSVDFPPQRMNIENAVHELQLILDALNKI